MLDLCSLAEGAVFVFVLDQERAGCSSCTAEPWLLVLQLWQPQPGGGSPRRAPVREHHSSSTLRTSPRVSVTGNSASR